jgi:hypothetical protein
MKYIYCLCVIFLFSNLFAQKGKKETEQNINWELKYDTLVLKHEEEIIRYKHTIDTLMSKYSKPVKTTKQKITLPENQIKSITTLIGKDQWSISNFGGASQMNNLESEQVLKFLRSKNFNECHNDEEWSDNLESNLPAFFVLSDTLHSLGFYFNVTAIKELESILENTEWRIASHNDFSNLYSHAASLLKSLKLTTTFSPFHLIAGNPTDEMLLKKAKWNMKVVDIYNLNIFPYTYYTGFIELLGDEDYIEYFSSFDESGNVVVTHISPDNKLPFKYAYGSESLNYGFLIRLIKK